jgi:CheY-like chemotaxis protein
VLTGLAEKRVLVADEERHTARLIQVNLERQGCTVTLVADGQAAISELERAEFDIAVLDERMPHVDGLGVLAWIRTHERTAGMKVGMFVEDLRFWQERNDVEHRADFYWQHSKFFG